MAVINALRYALVLAILAVSLLPVFVMAGDEDTKPAYMIYIDPETGKYTTEDPYADVANDRVVRTEPTSEIAEPKIPARIVGLTALAVLVVGALIGLQRKQHMSQL